MIRGLLSAAIQQGSKLNQNFVLITNGYISDGWNIYLETDSIFNQSDIIDSELHWHVFVNNLEVTLDGIDSQLDNHIIELYLPNEVTASDVITITLSEYSLLDTQGEPLQAVSDYLVNNIIPQWLYSGVLTLGTDGEYYGWYDTYYGSITPVPIINGFSECNEIYWVYDEEAEMGYIMVYDIDSMAAANKIKIGGDDFDLIDGKAESLNNPFYVNVGEEIPIKLL